MASMTNCTQSWPMHPFWRCAIHHVAQSHASWMQLNKMLGALLCLVLYWGSWRLSTVYWIYEHSPTYIFLLVTSRWKLLTEINKYWPGCRQLAWFPRHKVLPTHSWTTVTIRLPSTDPHIHLNYRSTIKVNTLYTLDQVPEGRPPALHCSFQAAPEGNCSQCFLPWKLCLSFAMALSNTKNSSLS